MEPIDVLEVFLGDLAVCEDSRVDIVNFQLK